MQSKSSSAVAPRISQTGLTDFELFLPTPIYNKMQIGVISNRSRLDDILEVCKVPYEEYIFYVEAIKVRTQINLLISNFVLPTDIYIEAESGKASLPCPDSDWCSNSETQAKRNGQSHKILIRSD